MKKLLSAIVAAALLLFVSVLQPVQVTAMLERFLEHAA